MLKLEHLTAAYPDGTKPVQDVSLCVEDGQRVALIGANGAGKTSLILSLVGVLPADGAVTVDGLTLCPENLPALRRKIGVVFQDPDDQLFMPTVLEDVAFGLENQGPPKGPGCAGCPEHRGAGRAHAAEALRRRKAHGRAGHRAGAGADAAGAG